MRLILKVVLKLDQFIPHHYEISVVGVLFMIWVFF